MARRRNKALIFPFPEMPPEREKTVLLDQFGTGTTWGYERSDDGRWCTGEPVDNRRVEQTSQDMTWRNRWGC